MSAGIWDARRVRSRDGRGIGDFCGMVRRSTRNPVSGCRSRLTSPGVARYAILLLPLVITTAGPPVFAQQPTPLEAPGTQDQNSGEEPPSPQAPVPGEAPGVEQGPAPGEAPGVEQEQVPGEVPLLEQGPAPAPRRVPRPTALLPPMRPLPLPARSSPIFSPRLRHRSTSAETLRD